MGRVLLIDVAHATSLIITYLSAARAASRSPLVEWSAEELEMLTETCAYIRSLARLGRELEVLNGD
jgi:hypothetical protein